MNIRKIDILEEILAIFFLTICAIETNLQLIETVSQT